MRVAFVVQRYGIEVNGGAELLCRRLAERLAKLWKIDVLTTCAKDYVTWKDEYPEGVHVLGDVTIRRFPVTWKRNSWFFSKWYDVIDMAEKARERGGKWGWLYRLYRYSGARWFWESVWMALQGPYSRQLSSYIHKHKNEYDAFVFFTYGYATTYYNFFKVASKAVMLPMAHDDVAYKLTIYQKLFNACQHFVFLTPEEEQLVKQRGSSHWKSSHVLSLGTDIPDVDANRFREERGIWDPFIIYVGRVEELKGVPTLVHNFVEYKKRNPGPLKLVVIGKEFWKLPELEDIIPLGFVSEQCKNDAIAAAEVLAMPSAYESLSIVLLEAWGVKTPVMVTIACQVLVGQCQRSGGGLVYSTTEDFIEKLGPLLNSEVDKKAYAENGYNYVKENYIWDHVEQTWDHLIRDVARQGNKPKESSIEIAATPN